MHHFYVEAKSKFCVSPSAIREIFTHFYFPWTESSNFSTANCAFRYNVSGLFYYVKLNSGYQNLCVRPEARSHLITKYEVLILRSVNH